MAIKYLSGNRVTALSTDLVTETTTTVGSVDSHADVDYGTYKQITGLTSGDKITGVVLHIQNASTNIKVAVFTDSSNAPSTLLGGTTTKAVSISSTNTAEEFTLDTSVTVPSDGKVWVCMYPQAGINLQKTTSGSSVYTNSRYQGTSSSYSAAFPSTMWGSTGQGSYNVKFGVIISTPKLGSTSPTPTPTSSGGTLNLTNGGSTVLTTIPLGFTASNTWVLRYKANFGTWSTNSYFHICLSDNDNPITSSQDELGVMYRNDSSSNNFGVHTVAGANPNSVNSQDQQTWSTSTSTDYYFEIVRESPTTAKIKFYGTDSTYGTVSATSSYASVSSDCDGLVKIKIMANNSTNTTGAVTISDIKFYNGITSASATDNTVNAQTNTIAEETDTGIHRIWSGSAWTEIA